MPDETDVSRHWTIDDLAYLPDEGKRYELIDGELIVSPAPFPLHQVAVLAICDALRVACPPDLIVFVSPIDYEISYDTVLQPDVVVMRRDDFDLKQPLRRPAVLTVEVMSTSSRDTDAKKKPAAYARSGAGYYWTFDPDELVFVAHRRRDADYVQMARVTGDQRLRLVEPYPVEICPAELVHG
jgi:Uma2 family endonuclease